MDSPSSPPPQKWILLLMAAVAVLAIAAGGWLSFRNLPAKSPAVNVTPPEGATEPPGDSASIAQPKAAVQGRKSPEQFGFPSYPTAFEFRSMEVDPDQGSSAYLVKRGGSAQIVRFYIEKLGAAGWQFDWKRAAQVNPKDQGKTLTLRGDRVRWIQRVKRRQLTLLTLDDSQKGRTAQVVLSWGPIPQSKPTR